MAQQVPSPGKEHADRREQLLDDERGLADFFENANVGLHWVGPDGIILRVNQTELDLLGYEREEYVGHHIAEFHVDRPVIDDMLARLLRGESLSKHPARLRCKDGSIRDVIVNSNALFEDGRFIHTRCFTLDVTEQKQAEEELRESEERFRVLADAAPVLIWMSGPKHEGVYYNQTWLTFTGRPAAEQLGDGWLELVHPEDRPRVQAACSQAFRVREPFTTEFRLKRADGQYRWLLDCGRPRFDPRGGFLGFVGSCVDITDHMQVEQALRESESRFRALTMNAPAAIFIKDLAGRYTLANTLASQALGRDDITGLTDHELMPVDLADRLRHRDLSVIDNGEATEQVEAVEGGGVRRDFLSVKFPLFDARGDATGVCGVAIDISARKQAEEVRNESEERLRLALEAGRMGTWEWKIESNEVLWSSGLEIIHGIEPGTFPGTFEAFESDMHAEDRQRVRDSIARTLECGDDHHIEYRLIRPDGGLRWVEGKGKLFRSEAGAPVRMIGVCTDITDRKRTEAALKAKEAELELVAETTPLILTRCSRDLRYLFVNRAAAALFGLTPDQMTGKPLVDVMGKQLFDVIKPRIDQVLRGEQVEYDAEIPYPIGRRWVRVNYMPDRDEHGKVVGWVASIVDITDRKRAEGALKESEERYRAIVESQTEMVCRFQIDGAILFINGAYARARGTTPEALLGENFWEFIDQEDRAAVRDMLDRLRPESPEVRIENRFVTADGTRWTLWTNRGLVFDAGGRVTEVQSAGIDITDRKQLEQSLKFLAEASRSLATLVDYKSTLEQVAQLAVPGFADWCSVDMLDDADNMEHLAIAHVDPAKVALAEEFYRRFLSDAQAHRGPIKIARTGVPELVPSITDPMLVGAAHDEEQLQILRELNPKSYMCVPLATKGKTLGVMTFVAAVSGRQYGADDLVMAEDLAHRAAIAIENARLYQSLQLELDVRRKAEEKLEHARQAAEVANRSKSEFLANMSHEIRTPMTAILGYADVLRLHVHDSDDVYCVDTIRRNGEFLLEIIGDILDLSRIEAGKLDIEKQWLAPDELLFDIRSLMEVRAAEKGLPLFVEYMGRIPERIESDPTRLRQILVNLIGNAIKFTDAGSVRLVVSFVPTTTGGSLLQFSVIDTGIGISAEQQRRLFEPFTQADSSVTRRFGGSGLGLSISHRLAEMLGGRITVESELGRGSTFTLTIATGALQDVPLVEPRQEIMTTVSPVALPRQLACRVLIVDDRREVRHLAQQFLEESGAQVIAAANGQEALAQVSQADAAGRPVDLVLLDMQMPIMDGYETATRLRQRRFDGPVVALTAHAMKGDRERCLQAGCDAYATKPIDRQRMVELVARYTQDVSREEIRMQRQLQSASPARPTPSDGASFRHEVAADTRAETQAGPPLRRVLIVDDCQDACRALQLLLQTRGYETVVARNGGDALAAAARHRPEVVLLDLNLPDMSGHDIARTLRQTEVTKDALLIAVSGHDSPDDIRRSREAGCDHHLVKPAQLDMLERLFHAYPKAFQERGTGTICSSTCAN